MSRLDRLDDTLVDFFDLVFFDELALFEEDDLDLLWHVELSEEDALMTAFDEYDLSEQEVLAIASGFGSMGLAQEVPG